MKKMLAVLLLVAVLSAQSTQAEESVNAQPLTTYIKVDGKPCVATTAEEFVLLTECVQTVNALKRNKAAGDIDEAEYKLQVSSIITQMQQNGITVYN